MQSLPETIGRYRVIRRLGAGGMAEVFLAERESGGGFRKQLVIKRLLPHLALDPRMVEQLEREARIGAVLTHPNLVQTWDLDVDERKTPFIVLAYVEGRTLKSLALSTWERGVPLPIELSVGAIASAALGLHYLHEAHEGDKHLELVHRDISPDNLMLEDDGTVRVMDFGVARMGAATVALTEEGELKGKIPFMPPEQLRGDEVDRRCDIYALGVTLYWLLTGQRPFEDGSDIDGRPAAEMNPAVLIQRALNEPVPAVSRLNAEVPAELEDVVMRMLAKEAAGRPSTAAEVHDALLNVVPVARFATEQFMREACKPTPSSVDRPRTTTLAARMLTVPQRKAWSADDSGVVTSIETPAGRPATVTDINAYDPGKERRRMGLSAAAGALIAVVVGGLAVSVFGGNDGDKAVVYQRPERGPVDRDSNSDPGTYDGDRGRGDAELTHRDAHGDDDGAAGGGAVDKDTDEHEDGLETDPGDDGRPSAVDRRRRRRRRRPRARADDTSESAVVSSPPRTAKRTQVVNLRAPSGYDWKVGGRALSGNRTQTEVPVDQRTLTAVDRHLDGTITVPIKDGEASVYRVRKGRLQVYLSPAFSNVRLGDKSITSGEVMKLTEGTYRLHYTVNRRAKEREVKVEAGRSTRVSLP